MVFFLIFHIFRFLPSVSWQHGLTGTFLPSVQSFNANRTALAMVDAVENRIENHTLQTPACHDVPLQHGELGIDADKS
jgi:hypothetical protein